MIRELGTGDLLARHPELEGTVKIIGLIREEMETWRTWTL